MRAFRASVIAIFIIAFAATPAWAESHRPSIQVRTSLNITATWQCQDHLYPALSVYKRRTAARSPWVHHTASYWRRELNLWKLHRNVCTAKLESREKILRHLHDGISHFYRTQGYSSGPLSGHERAIEAAARRHNLSPYFLFAASVTESSGGLAACHPNRKNIWGLASCSTTWGRTPVPEWSSWEQAFDWYARFLHGQVGVSSGWPNARTTYDYTGYAKCSSCWGSSTASHMRQYFGVDNATTYPWPPGLRV